MKFEITMSKPTFEKIKKSWEFQDYEPNTDAKVIRELFIVDDGLLSYLDLRDKVKVKKVED